MTPYSRAHSLSLHNGALLLFCNQGLLRGPSLKVELKEKNYLCTSIHLWTASFWPIRIQRPELLSWYMRGPPESPAHGSWYSPSGPFLSSVPNIMKCWKFFMETLRLTLFSWELCCAVHFWLLSSIMNLQHTKQSDQSSTNIKKKYPPYLLWSQW